MADKFRIKPTAETLERQVRASAELLEDDEIADRFGITIAQVRLMTRDIASARGWWVKDNKTGRVFRARSRAGAYRIVCMRGLTDWSWGKGQVEGQGEQP